MAYIGNIPADKYQTLQKQSFTTSATDTYTLSYAVTNPQDLALFINNVRQNPNDAYTVSGTTLTLSSAITGSDTMYAVFLGRAVETVAPAIGSVTNSMLANSSITLNGSAVSLGGSATVGGNNTPSFSAYRSSNVSVSASTNTLLIFDTEDYDTNSAYNTSDGKFTVPSGEGGKYFLYGVFRTESPNSMTRCNIHFLKNGSTTISQFNNNQRSGGEASSSCSFVGTLSAGDYVQVRMFQNSGATETVMGGSFGTTQFMGFKLIGA